MPASRPSAASTRTRSSADPTSAMRSTSASRPSWSTTPRRWRSSWFHRKRVRLLLRVSFRNPDTIIDLSRKFGCDADAAVGLIEHAHGLGLRVVGLSFHAGSQLPNPGKYVEAIDTCGRLVAEAAARGLPPLEVLDIGGGFPIDYLEPVTADRRVLRADPRGARAPAGGLAHHRRAGTLHLRTGGRRDLDRHGPLEARRTLVVLPRRRDLRHLQRPAVRQDALPDRAALGARPSARALRDLGADLRQPRRHRRGPADAGARDRRATLGRQIGAYTMACATDFNFFPRAKVVAVNVERGSGGP